MRGFKLLGLWSTGEGRGPLWVFGARMEEFGALAVEVKVETAQRVQGMVSFGGIWAWGIRV